jgi:hypothetical protein
VVGGFEVNDLEAQVLHAEVVLRAEGHKTGDSTQGVGRLAGDDVKERLVGRCQPLEVEVHLLQGLNEDDVESALSIDEGLGKKGSLHYMLDDEWVGSWTWDMDPMISSRERDHLLRLLVFVKPTKDYDG